MNYTGGKFKLLPQIIPLFPQNINTFIDMFGGGFNVGININANKIIYNDLSVQVMQLLEYFQKNNLDIMLKQIENWINEYELSKINYEGFSKFRTFYNSNKNPLALYTLICYAFNNQIRFNKSGEYNMPFSYKPLWKKLIDNDMTKKELMESIPISKSTIDKMGRGENVSLEIVDKICNFFNCPITDVIKHIEKEKDI